MEEEEEVEARPPDDPVRAELFPAPSAAAPGREPAALAAAAAAGAGVARGSGGATLRAARLAPATHKMAAAPPRRLPPRRHAPLPPARLSTNRRCGGRGSAPPSL